MIKQRLRTSWLAAEGLARRVRRPRRAAFRGDVEDPFFATFFSRIPEDVACSFTPAQLDAVKLAFGARVRGAHAIDVRLSLPLGRRWGYFVLLAGLERRTFNWRSFKRLFRPFLTLGQAITLALFLLMIVGSLFVVVYVGKRSAGLDLVPGIDMLNDLKVERMLH
jgi:hypothetical protein